MQVKFHVLMISLMTSQDHKVGQILKLLYISLPIFELQRRSKAQNDGNVHGYPSGIFNFRYNFR